jgi:hypothetical protein
MYFILRPYFVQNNYDPNTKNSPPGGAPQFGNLCRIGAILLMHIVWILCVLVNTTRKSGHEHSNRNKTNTLLLFVSPPPN